MVPVNNPPNFNAILLVEEIWDILQTTLSNVIRYTEGAVCQRGCGSLQDFEHSSSFSTRRCKLIENPIFTYQTLSSKHVDIQSVASVWYEKLVERMHHGDVAQQRHCKDLRQQVSPQQVTIEFMHVELGTSHKDLCQQPVVITIIRKEDWVSSPGCCFS